MTVIVVRDGIIAADSCAVAGRAKWPTRKLVRRGNVAIGCSGSFVDGRTFGEWYFAGADRDNLPAFHNRNQPDDAPDFHALVLKPDGWEFWTEKFQPELPCDHLWPFHAIGSGRIAAMAAMHMGASAVEAAEIACKVTDGCEPPVMHEIIIAK